jgi:prolyl-tRNA synthetase
VDTLLDDRDLRAGAKFKDADLLGTPVRVTIGSRSLGKGEVEIKLRSEAEGGTLPVDEAARRIQERVRALYG